MEERQSAGRGVRGRLRGVFVLLGLLPFFPLQAADVMLPADGTDQHLGVVTCAGSTCHGAAKPFANSNVLQNEFVTWHRQDKHGQAYKVLLNDDSKRIARNLGLESAETAKICLDCHADNIPENSRGPRFQISDGVGCEACHGGAERYLGPHVARDASHSNNISLGMFPTEKPAERATLCLSCHLGTKDKFATHEIMGAGHPRTSFELDTFSDIQPAHFMVDADYKERKGAVSGAQVWAAGQVMAVRQYLDVFIERQGKASGLFPELSFFDCLGCHRSLKEPRWTPSASTGLAPGSVRMNDSNMLMLKHMVAQLVPGKAGAFRQGVVGLHKASTRSMPALLKAAAKLRDLVAGIEAQVLEHGYTADDMKALLRSVVKDGVRGHYNEYAAAEQATMALGSLINAMKSAGAASEAEAGKLDAALDRVYDALQDADKYRPGQFVSALRSLDGV